MAKIDFDFIGVSTFTCRNTGGAFVSFGFERLQSFPQPFHLGFKGF
jgi:hypothetical protein